MVYFAIGERSLFEKWFWSGAFRTCIIDRLFSANLLVNYSLFDTICQYLMLLANILYSLLYELEYIYFLVASFF